MTFYSNSSKAPIIHGTFGVVANQLYHVQIEVMRTDTGSSDEKVSSITLNDASFGSCNPDGDDNECTYYECPYSNNVDHLTKQEIYSIDDQIEIELRYTDTVDSTQPVCPGNNTFVTAAVRVTLDPGIIY